MQKFLQPSSAPSEADSADLAISQAGEFSAEQQELPRPVDRELLVPPASLSVSWTEALVAPTSQPPTATAATPDHSADNLHIAPAIVHDVVPVVVVSAAVLPATSVQTDLPSHTLDSNVTNSNVQSVALLATTVNATQDVVVSTLAARYLLPHEKVRKLSKAPTHLEVLSIVDDLSKTVSL